MHASTSLIHLEKCPIDGEPSAVRPAPHGGCAAQGAAMASKAVAAWGARFSRVSLCVSSVADERVCVCLLFLLWHDDAQIKRNVLKIIVKGVGSSMGHCRPPPPPPPPPPSPLESLLTRFFLSLKLKIFLLYISLLPTLIFFFTIK